MPKKKNSNSPRKPSLYGRVIVEVFHAHYKPGTTRFTFTRDELKGVVETSGVDFSENDESEVAKNLGDIVYAFRFRRDFPKEIRETAPSGKMWIITGKGDAKYEFRLITTPNLKPDNGLFVTKLHDATPEIVRRFDLGDEQAVLARLRYNRLVDLFCRCVAHSLQNHLRTKVEGVGQIEIDELYVGADRKGEHFIIPVQAKKKNDRLGVSQLLQDLEYCQRAYPDMRPRLLGAQMIRKPSARQVGEELVVVEFECRIEPDDVIISKVGERRFLLLPHASISSDDLKEAAKRTEQEQC